MKITTFDWIVWGFKTVFISLAMVLGFVFSFSAFLSIQERGNLASQIERITSDVMFDIILIVVTLILMLSIGFLEYIKMRNRD